MIKSIERTTLQGQLKFVDLFELWGNRGPRALLVSDSSNNFVFFHSHFSLGYHRADSQLKMENTISVLSIFLIEAGCILHGVLRLKEKLTLLS